MGEVFYRYAAVDEIFGDVRRTLENAKKVGSRIQELAEEKLESLCFLIEKIEAELAATREQVEILNTAIDEIDEKADRFLAKLADDIWNGLGRPVYDAGLDILFPGGVAYYAEGSDEEQPDRMELLAELLQKGIHPRLDATLSESIASEIRMMVSEFRQTIQAAKTPKIRGQLLERIRKSLSRTAYVELVALKKRYLSEGFDEDSIHNVIPDRSASVVSAS